MEQTNSLDPQDLVIVAAKRTPIGAMLGNLSGLTAPELGAVSNKAAIEQAGVSFASIDEVYMGCVLQAGIGQAPARQAAIFAGIPASTPATTINKMCGSGMKAVMIACDSIKAGSANLILAGGMESMSNAPYLLAKARAGYRLGHGELKDHMFLDGLEDAYEQGQLMGKYADATAKHFLFNRVQQDGYASRSMSKSLQAIENGYFKEEIAPVLFSSRKGDITISQDEGPDEAKIAKIPHLKPAFSFDGTVTAANSSSISDGAATLIITTASYAKKQGLKPMAKIVAYASHAQAPEWFTTAPVDAINKVLDIARWSHSDVDLFEINEAFAVVVMAAIQQLALNEEKVNIHGGGCALGHPIGASGARILVTLLYALKRQQKKRGLAALCIGGGEATAIAIELV